MSPKACGDQSLVPVKPMSNVCRGPSPIPAATGQNGLDYFLSAEETSRHSEVPKEEVEFPKTRRY